MVSENSVDVVFDDLSAGSSVSCGVGGSRVGEYFSVFRLERISDDEGKSY